MHLCSWRHKRQRFDLGSGKSSRYKWRLWLWFLSDLWKAQNYCFDNIYTTLANGKKKHGNLVGIHSQIESQAIQELWQSFFMKTTLVVFYSQKQGWNCKRWKMVDFLDWYAKSMHKLWLVLGRRRPSWLWDLAGLGVGMKMALSSLSCRPLSRMANQTIPIKARTVSPCSR